MGTKKISEEMNYEKKLEKVEEILNDIENNRYALHDAVVKYKEGMKLIDECSSLLDQVEKELKVIEREADSNA